MDSGTLSVPGAEIYHEVRGSGPALLLINGGDGDAAMYAPLAGLLADRYTVVTYDRRGHSRSRRTGPAGEQLIGRHTDDAHLLLRAVGGEPAYVLGNSYGAMIGMDLLARHPAQVRLLVAHEPFVVDLLPDAGRWHDLFQEVVQICRRDGVDPALRRFGAEVGVDLPPPPTGDLPAPVREMLARIHTNLETTLEYELRSFTRFTPALDVLRDGRLVVAGGAESHDTLPYRITAALAERLGTRTAQFPGGHGGYLTHAAAFAEALHDVLDHRDSRPG